MKWLSLLCYNNCHCLEKKTNHSVNVKAINRNLREALKNDEFHEFLGQKIYYTSSHICLHRVCF